MIKHKKHVPSFIFGNPNHCTYCGSKPSSIDHVIPVSSYKNRRTNGGKDAGVRTYACGSCNSRLGAKSFQSFHQRIEYILGKIKKSAAKFKRTASWTDEEIAEMDHTLRSYIANRQLEMREADQRSTWTASGEFRAIITTLSGVHSLDPDSPKFVEWLYRYFGEYAPNKL